MADKGWHVSVFNRTVPAVGVGAAEIVGLSAVRAKKEKVFGVHTEILTS